MTDVATFEQCMINNLNLDLSDLDAAELTLLQYFADAWKKWGAPTQAFVAKWFVTLGPYATGAGIADVIKAKRSAALIKFLKTLFTWATDETVLAFVQWIFVTIASVTIGALIGTAIGCEILNLVQ
jgi:hypothetical protein